MYKDTHALIGAHNADVNGYEGSGMAYFYKWENNQWVVSSTASAPVQGDYQYFGYSLAIDDRRAAIGAYRYEGIDSYNVDDIEDFGAVFIYFYSDTLGWGFSQTVMPLYYISCLHIA